MPDATTRLATAGDAEPIMEIYNREVTTSTATFDLVPRSLADQREWLADRSGAFSAIVAVLDGDGAGAQVVGFASLSPYKERAAYRTTVEDSVYVHRDHTGQGIGRLLLARLVDIARDSGFHTVIARIEAGGDGVAGAARGVRLRAGRRRTPGRPQVRPLARRRRHADRVVISWAGKDLNLRRH